MFTGNYTSKLLLRCLYSRNKKRCIVEKQTFSNIGVVMQQFVLIWNKWCMFPIRFEVSSFPRSGDEWWHFYLEAIWSSAVFSSLRQKTVSCLAVWRTEMAHFSRPISVTNEEFHKLKASCFAFVFRFSKTVEKLRIRSDYFMVCWPCVSI